MKEKFDEPNPKMSVEIMLNTCNGEFSFSDAAMDEYRKRCPEKEKVDYWNMDRHDPVMVQIVKEMGKRANGSRSKIELKKIPLEYLHHYVIAEDDGLEVVMIALKGGRILVPPEQLTTARGGKSEV